MVNPARAPLDITSDVVTTSAGEQRRTLSETNDRARWQRTTERACRDGA